MNFKRTFALLFGAFLTLSVSGQPILSEFMAINNRTLADEDGDFSDWIEIHNPGAASVSLEGWFLTDDPDNLKQWEFPAVSIPGRAYLVVFASGKNRAVAGAALHTTFNLASEGEYLALVRPDGLSVATEFAPVFPEQFADLSYGQLQGVNSYFSPPTPGAANSSAIVSVVSDTKFSHDRGFYEQPFALTITTATPGAQIRYTTNGVPPTATTGLVYNGPIPINGTTALRAAAFRNSYRPSNVDTQTYLFLNDVIRQASNGQAPPGWPASWGGNTVDYGMDPDVVNNPLYSGTIKDDLKSLPSFSIVMSLTDLFNSTTGIYANPGQDGRAWERPASVELIHPDGTKGFQVNAGIRIRGGFSRSTQNPKHALRLFFREEYGDAKLEYPLFGDDGTDTFDAIDLRTFQNYSWSFQGDSRGVFLRDQFSRDTQLDMGRPSTRGEFYHLYINGYYWGLYNTQERSEASYGETYFGGDKEDYDVIKVEAGPYTINATDGDMAAWTRLYNAARTGFASNDAYQRIQGRNPDGTRNPDYENLLDVPNLIDYMLVILFGGNLDAPISNFLGNNSPNNWYGMRDRNGTDGFRFFSHDAEHTLLDVNQDRTGPYSSGDTSVTKSNPQWIWQKLQQNAEFKILVADHVHRHFFNGGALTASAARDRFLRRKNEIDRAVVGESARWGDAKRSSPFTRTDWLNAINGLLNNHFPQRPGIVLNQLRTDGLYPAVVAPAFSRHGGLVQPGYSLTMSAPAGRILFTRDGADPRLPGGAVSPGAQTYSAAIPVLESVHLKSRVLNGTTWSALNEASFTVIQTFTELVVTEVMYNPLADAGADGEAFEFIELKNVGAAELDLSGVRFSAGVDYTFPNGTRLGPGKFLVLAANPGEFRRRYPNAPVFAAYSGNLSNSGERLTLDHAAGATIATFAYGDAAPWPGAADGAGFSLVPVNANLSSSPDNAAFWRASSQPGGSPGTDDPPVQAGIVWVTEVLTHTDLPEIDAIELHNPTAAPVDVSNWYLSDDRSTPKKFRIPAGTVIPPGGYHVFTEDQFNPTPGTEPSFTLNSHGESVYLYSADAAGNLTGYSDGFSFGAAANGVTFGRFETSIGELDYPAQASKTLGLPNSGPLIGPVVFNEIHYQPPAGDAEFLELKNLTGSTVRLYDPLVPANTWKINGIDFAFPANSELPPNGLALVVASDPSNFRTRYGVPAQVAIFGPFLGNLQNSGERLQLLKPDAPDVASDGAVFVPYVVVDEVRYNDKLPWPSNAAGAGPSLEKIVSANYGNDPKNWRASFGPASAGLENNGNRLPVVSAGPDQAFESDLYPATANLAGTVADDGLPNPPGQIEARWTRVSGPGPVQFSNANALTTSASFPSAGTYALRFTASDGELSASDDLLVEIKRPSTSATLLTTGAVWKYLDDGSDQGTAWRQPSFNDSGWPSGASQLGYGDGDEAKVIGFGPSASDKYRTAYFRKSFPIQNARAVTELTVHLLRDDGAIVYLNGTEVVRSNMPLDDVNYRTFASGVVGNADESAFQPMNVDPSILVDGNNVLAVEVHQVNANSSDLSFDLRLTGLMTSVNQAPTVSAGADLTVAQASGAALRGAFTDDGLPESPGLVTVAWRKFSGPGEVTFSDSKALSPVAQFSTPGSYVLRLEATDGALSASDDVAVTVTGGETFEAWRGRLFTASELADSNISGDSADPDSDGHSNRQEYTAGTHPKDAQSVLQWRATQVSAAGVRLEFEAVAGRTYIVQYRDAVASGSWNTLQEVGSRETTRVEPINDAFEPLRTSRYYRVLIATQP